MQLTNANISFNADDHTYPWPRHGQCRPCALVHVRTRLCFCANIMYKTYKICNNKIVCRSTCSGQKTFIVFFLDNIRIKETSVLKAYFSGLIVSIIRRFHCSSYLLYTVLVQLCDDIPAVRTGLNHMCQ